MDEEIYKILEKELTELIERAEKDTLALDANPSSELTNSLFRSIHTIKGNAGMVGLKNLETISHSLEAALDKLRKDISLLNSDFLDLVLRAIDKIKEIISDINAEEKANISSIKSELENYLEEKKLNSTDVTKAKAGPDLSYYQEKAISENKNFFLCNINLFHIPQQTLSAFLKDLNEYLQEDIVHSEILEDSIVPLDSQVFFHSSILQIYCLTEKFPDLFIQKFGLKTEDVKIFYSSTEKNNSQANVLIKNNSSRFLKLDSLLMDEIISLSMESVIIRNQLIQKLNFEEDSDEGILISKFTKMLNQLNEKLIRTRLQKFGTIATKIQRIIRETATTLGKKIDFKIIGEDVELDEMVIESFSESLTHIIRNSIDHGIEDSQTRIEKGKSEKGNLLINAFLKSGNVHIEVKDDGKGLDLEKIKETAIRKQLVSREAIEKMDSTEIAEIIFYPGFSTSDKVTQVSGRGVGMDVVLTKFKMFGGQVKIKSEHGKGTTITGIIPQIISSMPAFIIVSHNTKFAILQKHILGLSSFQKDLIEEIDNRMIVRFREDRLPFISLESVLYPNDLPLDQNRNIAAIVSEEVYFAISFDYILSIEEVIIKPLPSQLKSLKIFSGITLLGDGSIVPVLEPEEILKLSKLNQEHSVKRQTIQTIKKEDSNKNYIIFSTSNKLFMVDSSLVGEVFQIQKENIVNVLDKEMIKLNHKLINSIRIENLLKIELKPDPVHLYSIGLKLKDKEYGILAHTILDVYEYSQIFESKEIKDSRMKFYSFVDEEIALLFDPNLFQKELGE